MTLSWSHLYKQKQISKKVLEKKYNIPRSRQFILLLDIIDDTIRNSLIEACKIIDIEVLLYRIEHNTSLPVFSGNDFSGVDIFLTDMERTVPLIEIVQAGVVPILPEMNSYGKSFSQFNPMRFEGNAFLYNTMNVYTLFEQIVRYMENVRFPEDRNVLLQNVVQTF